MVKVQRLESGCAVKIYFWEQTCLLGNNDFSNSEFKKLKRCCWQLACQPVPSVSFIQALFWALQNWQVNSFSVRDSRSYWNLNVQQCISFWAVMLWVFSFSFPLNINIYHMNEWSRMFCTLLGYLKTVFEFAWNNVSSGVSRVCAKALFLAWLPISRFVPRKRGIALKEDRCAFKPGKAVHLPTINTYIMELWVVHAKWCLISCRITVGLVCSNSWLALKSPGGLLSCIAVCLKGGKAIGVLL